MRDIYVLRNSTIVIRNKQTLSKHLIEVNCNASYKVVGAIVFIVALQNIEFKQISFVCVRVVSSLESEFCHHPH